jgi:hypothetical protein
MPPKLNLPPESIVNDFAYIYYFFTCLRHSEQKAGLLEPRDAILWFLDLKGANDKASAILKKDLISFVVYWWGAPMQRHYEALAEEKLIDHFDNEDDAREKVVWLTPQGATMLHSIKSLRYDELLVLWKSLNLSATESKKLIKQLKRAAAAAAAQMSAESKSG